MDEINEGLYDRLNELGQMVEQRDAEIARLGSEAEQLRGASVLDSARGDFLAASVAVWREIDRLDAEPEGYHPVRMSVELRRAERAAWEKYRDLLDARPASMLEPVTFADDESGLKRAPMRPADEAEDVW